MQTGNERWRDERPKAVRLFYHLHFGAAPEIHSDLRSVGSFDAKLNPPGTINARILCAPNVGRRRLKITRLLRPTETSKKRAPQTREQNDPKSFHLVSPCLFTEIISAERIFALRVQS
jgi:hypothetical protein